jgi:hypothetical protein
LVEPDDLAEKFIDRELASLIQPDESRYISGRNTRPKVRTFESPLLSSELDSRDR